MMFNADITMKVIKSSRLDLEKYEMQGLEEDPELDHQAWPKLI
jgi:hypothetical protein